MVSVIVPTRNSARTLSACLASVRAQRAAEIELIVVDNASSDDTWSIANRFADVVVARGPERSAQRNFGATIAKGDHLFFVDSDMVLTPKLVSECAAILINTNAPAVIVPEVSVGQGFWAACRALERSCYGGEDLIEAARFFRRSSFKTAAGFDEELRGGEDWDLSVRVAQGTSLPRSVSHLIHDEGRPRLMALLAKKRYYAGSFVAYWRKHPRLAMSQASIRGPAFIRNWNVLVRHPLLAIGIILLKALEIGAALSVVLPQLIARKSVRSDGPVERRGSS
jgi:glycosyltransferase involved in cell wall biosynthesis